MKRVICVLLALLLLVGTAGAFAGGFDFSGLTLEELYDVRAQLDMQIQAAESTGGARVYESGSYAVGGDIPAGDYVLIESEDAVFASVIVREGASEDAGLVTYHLINRQAVIRFAPDTWVTLTEARAYPIAQAPLAESDPVDEGGYLVGAQLPAGRYEVAAVEKAPLSSYSVYDGILGTGAQLTKFEVLRDAAEIELTDGEYVELSGCTLTAAGIE